MQKCVFIFEFFPFRRDITTRSNSLPAPTTCQSTFFNAFPFIKTICSAIRAHRKWKQQNTIRARRKKKIALISLINSHLLNYNIYFSFLIFLLLTVQQEKLNWKHSAVCESKIEWRSNNTRRNRHPSWEIPSKTTRISLRWRAAFERSRSSRFCRSESLSCQAVAMAAVDQSSVSRRHQSVRESKRKICVASSVTYLTSQGL